MLLKERTVPTLAGGGVGVLGREIVHETVTMPGHGKRTGGDG
jgi:hypothetical protein